jgi:hypothetical protein
MIQTKSDSLAPIGWHEASVNLPKELEGSREGIFDFDNDGKLDRVLERSFEANYMDGSVLLIQPGRSSSSLIVANPLIDKTSVFLPCQMDTARHDIRDCPPFSQKNDESGFSMKGRTGKDLVYFRTRYSTVTPFSFQGITYIGVRSTSEETENYVAVLKPLPNGKFQQQCPFRRVAENF